jgi:cell division protein FtsW (lipid II flippase)
VSHDLIGPDIRDSVFAHIVHVLLIGGVVVYSWKAVTALVRKPTSIFLAVRHTFNAAWLAVLLLILTRVDPVPFLQAGVLVAVVLLVFKLWDRLSSRAPERRNDADARREEAGVHLLS